MQHDGGVARHFAPGIHQILLAREGRLIRRTRLKHLAFAILVLALATLGGHPAGAQTLQKVEILEFGLMTVGEDMGESHPPNEGFEHHAVDGARADKETRSIPGKLGVTFGIRYRYVGEPIGGLVPVTVRLVFPPPGLKSPAGTKVLRYDDIRELAALGLTGFMSMTFDHVWEIVPGTWRMQIWSGGKKLADEPFEVFIPPSV